MKILWAIISCILLWYFWIWLIQNIFSKAQKKISRNLFYTCLLLVGSLFVFSFLLDYFFPEISVFEEWQILSMSRLWSFVSYCAIIFLFLILFNKNWRSPQIWFLFFTRMCLFVFIGFFWLKIWISTWVLYYLILAYSEEFLKMWATENEVNKTDFYSSDLLFFSIFIALWFSIIENFFYLWKELFFSQWEWIFSLVFWRWIFTSLLHFFATWIIALILFKFYQQKHLKSLKLWLKLIRICIALLVWVLIHRWYNLSIQYSSAIIYIVLVIWWYFLLTYLLYLSDSLYIRKD